MTYYKELIVWKKSYELGLDVYKVTKSFPVEEKYGIISQMRRCAISIPSNIAEGSKRSTKKDYRSFILIALGSSAELETQISFSRDLKYLKVEDAVILLSKLDEVMKMLTSMAAKLA